jgi:dienelactone hydrolase
MVNIINYLKGLIMKTTILSIIIFILIFILTSCSFEASGKIERMKFAELRDSVFSRFIKIKEDTTNFEDCIKIKPFNKVLMGTLINIKLDNLPQNKNITLHAYRKNWEGLIYSFACFKTDSKGQIQLNKDKPISATYSGVDSLGIFWSMTKPTYINEELPFEIKNLKLNTIYFQLEVDGKIISKDELRLILETPDIYCEEIRNKDMVANYYYPKNKQNLPLIIMLGGSNGGIREVDDRAKIVSSHGYAVLALGYFGMENLPKNLERIPLEYFFNSIDWAKEKQFIDTAKIVIIGVSKGGEAALLVASMRRDIKGAIAFVPSNVRWQGIPDGPSFISKSSWTLNGNDLPYLKCSFSFSFFWKFICKSKQIEMREIFKPIITEDKSKIDPALIEVEKINGPILLIAGKDDKLWPSYDMCQMMKYRLDSLKFEHQIECLNYDNAGHFIFGPDLMPTINYKYDQIAVGGKDSENSAAQIDSWNKMIGFLQTYFPVE